MNESKQAQTEHELKRLFLAAQDNGWSEIPKNMPFEVNWEDGCVNIKANDKIIVLPVKDLILNRAMVARLMPEDQVSEFIFNNRASWRRAALNLIEKCRNTCNNTAKS